MLIELTGCTGSGKSTLLKKIRARFAELGIETTSLAELIFGTYASDIIYKPILSNIILDIIVFPKFVISFRKNFKLLAFSLKVLFKKPDSIIGALNRCRVVIRKIGIDEWIKDKKNSHKIIFVDEGTIHIAHNIFVYSGVPISRDDIEKFSSLIPIPDVIIHVTASKDVILKRNLTRKSFRIRFEPQKKTMYYIERALKSFEYLHSIDKIGTKTLTIDFSSEDNKEIYKAADKAVNFILRKPNN
ncbi:MAG: hypothetical protein PHW62_07235 [Candidatus Ratteibacteria bacterium]|nr:hypothetical protein [Candidatus Ratteibacteria bacterium]